MAIEPRRGSRRSFAADWLSSEAAQLPLASLRGRHATVVVWTPHSHYRQVEVAAGPYDRMKSEALRSMTSGPGSPPVLSDIAPAAPFATGMNRRAVLLSTAPRTEVAEALGRSGMPESRLMQSSRLVRRSRRSRGFGGG